MMGRRTGLIIANTLVGAVLGFVALKVLAVELGSYSRDIFGQFAFAMGLAGLLSIATDLGFSYAHIKRVSEGRDLGALTGSLAVVKVALCGGVVLVAAAGAWTASRLGILQDTTPGAIVLVALFFALLGLRGVFTATFDGRSEFAKSQALVLVENAVRVPLMVLVALAFGGTVLQQGPLQGWAGTWVEGLMRTRAADLLAATYAVGALASLGLGWLLFRRGYPLGRPRRSVLEDYWGFARHMFLAIVVGTVYVNLDKIVITAFWTTDNTGVYYGAQRFSDLIGMVPMAVYTVLFPTLSGSFARGEKAQVRAAVEAALRHVSLVVVPLAAFTIVLAAPLLSLVLTGEFAAGVPTLRLLVMFAVVFALVYPYASLLQALGRPDLTARIAIQATVVNAVLNLALVPPAGALFGLPTAGLAEVGSAGATLAATVLQLFLVRRAVHALEGRVRVRRHVGKHGLAGAALLAALWLAAPPVLAATAGPGCTLDLCPEGAPAYAVLALLGLGAGVYLGLLVLLREFGRRDLKLYLSILHPAEMARYVAEEVQAHGPGREAPSLQSEQPGR